MTGLLLGRLLREFRELKELQDITVLLEEKASRLITGPSSTEDWLLEQEKTLEIKKENDLLEPEEEKSLRTVLRLLRQAGEKARLSHVYDREQLDEMYSALVRQKRQQVTDRAELAGEMLDQAFSFLEESFGGEQEMLLLVTGLAKNKAAMYYMTEYGSEAFLHWSRTLAR